MFEWIDEAVEAAVSATRHGYPDTSERPVFRHGEPLRVQLTTERESYAGPRVYLCVDVQYRCPRTSGWPFCDAKPHEHWALYAYHPDEGVTLWQD